MSANYIQQKLEIISWRPELSQLVALGGMTLPGGNDTLLGCVQDVFGGGVLTESDFEYLKQKISKIPKNSKSLPQEKVRFLTASSQGKLGLCRLEAVGLKQIIEAEERTIKKQSYRESLDSLTCCLKLLEKERKIEDKLLGLKDIIKRLGALRTFGSYTSDEEGFFKYTLKDDEKAFLQSLRSLCARLQKQAKTAKMREELRLLATTLKQSIACAGIGLNPQQIINEQGSKPLSKFLFQQHAIYQIQYFHMNIKYKQEEGRYIPYFPEFQGGKSGIATMTKLEEIANRAIALGGNKWKVLANGFQHRSLDRWTSLEPVERIEGWKKGNCVEIRSYFPRSSQLNAMINQHAGLRLIDRDGNVYSIGIDVEESVSSLTSPDWKFFFPNSTDQEIVSRYRLPEEGFNTLIARLEEAQKLRVVLLDLEAKRTVARDELSNAKRDLRVRKEALKELKQKGKSTQEASLAVTKEHDDVRVKQQNFNQAQHALKEFLAQKLASNEESVPDSVYVLFGNNCASFASNFLDQAKELGAEPVVIDKTELKSNQRTEQSFLERTALWIRACVIRILGYLALFFRSHWVDNTYAQAVDRLISRKDHQILLPLDTALRSLADNALAASRASMLSFTSKASI